MAKGVRHFKRLLKAELEDLIEDIGLLEERYRERFAEIGRASCRERV